MQVSFPGYLKKTAGVPRFRALRFLVGCTISAYSCIRTVRSWLSLGIAAYPLMDFFGAMFRADSIRRAVGVRQVFAKVGLRFSGRSAGCFRLFEFEVRHTLFFGL